MKQQLSILIPTYNDVCTPLVEQLHVQATRIGGLQFEILVADDGSTEQTAVEANRAINKLSGCRLIERGFNSGRSAIRNFLAREAQYHWLLFIDSHMSVISDRFLIDYLEAEIDEVAFGGYRVGEGPASNLRYRYEKASEHMHTAKQRRLKPYQDFHTSNFLIRRDVMLAHPLDERFTHYGYEDVLFGKQLRQAGIRISHPDNPVGFDRFESNDRFLAKTEESLRTLYEFRDDLHGYSRLLTFVSGIHLGIVMDTIRLWHRIFSRLERRNLCGTHPSLKILSLYRLGFYLSLK